MPDTELLHVTSVMIRGRVLLIAGRSGTGKSDLALRLIDRGALLVSDDYTELAVRSGILYAAPPARIAGQIEIRSVGITQIEHARQGVVALILDLDQVPERLPTTPLQTTQLCGVAIPTLGFAAFECSAAIKAEEALRLHGLENMS